MSRNRPERRASTSKGADMSQEQYLSFKERALNSGIIRKTVSFAEIILLSEKLLEYAGVQFEMTDVAFKTLVKLCGMSNTQLEKINTALGEKTSHKILDMMKLAMSGTPGKNTVCMMVNKANCKVVDFAKAAESVLSNNAFFMLFEDVMNNHSGMHIKNMALTENGNVELSVINENWEFNIGGLNDEYFNSGLVFINTPSSTIINPFNERLVCTNGMVVASEGMSLILKNSSAEHVNGFFDAVRNLKGVLNFEQEFKKRVIRMMDTQASYAELLDVRRAVEYNVANTIDPEVRATIESFIPKIEVERAFMTHLINLSDIDAKTYKKIRTMLTVWDLVNKLTDLSSHPDRYGITLTSGTASIFALQREAGNLSFKDQYDLECSVKQIY
jgi:hypothetical protein